jgi:oxygen-independent coproporphyrinogen III oxidase
MSPVTARWDNQTMALGLYISVPFCRTKCTYCNFASDVFSRAVFNRYLDRVCSDLERAQTIAEKMGARFESAVDSLYLGGGTPTLLDSHQLSRLFVTIKQNFCLLPDAEITVECAPGTLSEEAVELLARLGVNRVSLGVQSFVDKEAAAVARLHKRETVLEEIARLRACGLSNINIDLIAGLPHQTEESWAYSLAETLGTGAPHVSVYMLEVDEDSRLGRELIAGGTKYHAHFVPDEDLTADLYMAACDQLNASGVTQYEISNFARHGFESKHNLKYWTRQPYFGFGVDAHSMLKAGDEKHVSSDQGNVERHKELTTNDLESVRLAAPDSFEKYVGGAEYQPTFISPEAALEEAFFLGLRLNCGLDVSNLEKEFGAERVRASKAVIDELIESGLLQQRGSKIWLTARGRLLSNEVFEKFLSATAV